MICLRCGKEIINDKLIYCTKCGTPLQRESEIQGQQQMEYSQQLMGVQQVPVLEDPVVVEETVVVEEPMVIEQPFVMNQPVMMQESLVINQPYVIEEQMVPAQNSIINQQTMSCHQAMNSEYHMNDTYTMNNQIQTNSQCQNGKKKNNQWKISLLVFLISVCVSVVSIFILSGIEEEKLENMGLNVVYTFIGVMCIPFLALIATIRNKNGKWIGLLAYFYFGAIALGIYSTIVVYDNVKMNTPMDLSAVSEEDLEDGIYVEGTIYKVMSKVGEYSGKSYYTVMLPSTDMADWSVLDQSYIGQALDFGNGKLPLSGGKAEDRRVLVVSTDDKKIENLFDKMVTDNEHWILSKIKDRKEYTGLFKVKEMKGGECSVDAFEAAAYSQDKIMEYIFWPGVNYKNFCYYELSACDNSTFSVETIFCYIVVILWVVFTIRAFVRWINKPKKKKAETKIMICCGCGNEVQEEASFCPMCGSSFEQKMEGACQNEQGNVQTELHKASKIVETLITGAVRLLFIGIGIYVLFFVGNGVHESEKVTERVEGFLDDITENSQKRITDFLSPNMNDKKIEYFKEYMSGYENAKISVSEVGDIIVGDACYVECWAIFEKEKKVITLEMIKIDDKWYVESLKR